MTVLDKIVEAAVAALMAALVILVFLAVVFRYGLNAPLTWSEEVGRVCLVWVSFLGAYLAHRRAEHIAVTAIVDRLPATLRRWSHLAVTLLFLAFLIVLAWYGGGYALRFMGSTTPLLDIPIGAVYLAMPVAAGLMALNILLTLAAALRSRGKADPSGPEATP